ncbi:MAG: hypothetical protein KDK62_02475 [Chlamydiia bacterium]|nr:hypothetical protein [Chlamydiia bacterium]
MRFIFLFLLTTALFAEDVDNPQNISGLIGGQLPLLIEGVVNPTNGALSLFELDAEAPSLCPITIDRCYTYQGWAEGNFGRLDYFCEPNDSIYKETLQSAAVWSAYKQPTIFKSFPEGVRSRLIFEHDPFVFEKGQTNLAGTEISGRTNPKNCTLKNEGGLVFSTGSGLKILFNHHRLIGDGKLMGKKISPNGHYKTYSYDFKDRLLAIDAFTRSGVLVTTARYTYDKNWTAIDLSNGSRVVYENWNPGQILRVLPSDGPEVIYEYDKKGRITKKKKPEGREL